MQFPDDENGDVLRRMAASGFDFGRVHESTSTPCSGEQANAALVARQLIEADRSENSLAGVSTDATQDGGTELKVVRKMLVSHHSVTAFEPSGRPLRGAWRPAGRLGRDAGRDAR